MASSESPRIQALVDNIRDRDQQQPGRGEQRPLLPTNSKRYRPTVALCIKRCCIRSKSALLILCWKTLVTLTFGYLYEFGSVFATDYSFPYQPMTGRGQFQTYAPLFFGVLAISYLFYPLAGCLADVRCGRYKTLLYTLRFITVSGAFACIGSIIVSLYAYYILPPKTGSIVVFAIGFGPPTAIGLTLLLFSSIVFNANIIQYGMDQLQDSPTEDSVLFINWFAFSSHLGVVINKVAVPVLLCYADRYYRPEILNIVKLHFIPIVAFLLLGASLAITYYKREWFMIDSGSRNPYKLVYKVIKFAAQHKIPIRRSSFTYCEDELPSRMDLGKEKYGGPFTTEQVEDVKVFLGILSILLTFGSFFVTDIAANNVLFKFSHHLYANYAFCEGWLSILFQIYLMGGLSEILIIILIPVYLCVLRPFIQRYIPGMLKRIGLGITIRVLSLLSVFLIDTVGHIYYSMDHKCFISIQKSSESLDISVWYVAVPYTLNALSDMLFYIATYEFICAQSPQAMKGLLIGTFFTIKGVFQLISVLVIVIPFTVWKFDTSFPSCGFVYYLVNIIVALIGLVAYTWVARRYQYRQRDEPDNIYRYAEEYYDRDQD